MTDAAFVRHRSLLFTVAYEMLGSAADAEDVVQETWLRWAEVDQAQVADPRSYLVKIVTRLALNRLRTLARQREDYVGPWLPEPLLIGPDPAHDAEFAENVSIAMLMVLETLGPAERVVFVLREVFQTPHEEIADAVGKTPAAVRQIARRAREHVAARRPRRQVSQAEQQAAVQRFLGAVAGEDPGLHGRARLDQRDGGNPDRRRRLAYRGEPGLRGRPDHPDLRDPQPGQAALAGADGGACAWT
jgi:RNA polymerase sigma factor (sigma-70 family)